MMQRPLGKFMASHAPEQKSSLTPLLFQKQNSPSPYTTPQRTREPFFAGSPFLNPNSMDSIYERKTQTQNAIVAHKSSQLPPTASLTDESAFARPQNMGMHQKDPMDEEVIDTDSWITIFGFPEVAISAVLRRMQKFGQIVEHRIGSGNWLHLRYQTQLQARQALSDNGWRSTIEGKPFMIGVMKANEASLTADSTVPGESYCVTRPNTSAHNCILSDDAEIYKYAPEKESFCSRLMAYVFNY
eukprot:TRINITY_DN774201_c0_g1_i1.p1 TRINITY_DN774201_c0_g1~~TRINITY_DN774201_c0_g1_i1.p1  ORF type:complete len:243 (+),score=44.48 TRINITY_DN774201_c0_g1_i1:98-826(+)